MQAAGLDRFGALSLLEDLRSAQPDAAALVRWCGPRREVAAPTPTAQRPRRPKSRNFTRSLTASIDEIREYIKDRLRQHGKDPDLAGERAFAE